ncbi:MAG: hypothetical protein ABIJ34_05250 [archaeon]
MNKKSNIKSKESGKSIKLKLSEGYIHSRAIVEIVGKPKEYVEDSLKSHLEKLKTIEGLELLEQKTEKAEPNENYFSAFAEIEILTVDIDTLFTFCYDFMPSSIEILEPEQIVVKNTQITDMLNDLQTRMHGLNTGYIEAQKDAEFYIRNTAVILRNFLVVMLSVRPFTLGQLEPVIGIKPEDIEKVLDVLINEGKVKKEGESYRAVPKVK